MLVLQFTDSLWKDHLLALDRLRQGVGLRGYGQRNPLLEYKREAFQMYQMMAAMRDEQVLKRVLALNAEAIQAAAQSQAAPTSRGPVGAAPRRASDVLGGNGVPAPATPATPATTPKPVAGDETRVFAEQYGVKRNDPCPCGSGKKFKKCCHKPSSRPSA
jgi:preprotein translocase subunit SecA